MTGHAVSYPYLNPMLPHFSIAWIVLMQSCLLAVAAISASAISAAALPDPITLPAQPIAQAPQPKPMTTLAEEFVSLAVKGDFVAAWQYIHPSLRTTWSPVDMQQGWHDLQDRTGAFQRFISSRQDDQSVVLVNTQFERVTDNLVVIFDDTHQWIVGIDFPQE